MTAPDRNRHHANLALDAGAPSTHDPYLPFALCSGRNGLVCPTCGYFLDHRAKPPCRSKYS
jgi:hypothetical protein